MYIVIIQPTFKIKYAEPYLKNLKDIIKIGLHNKETTQLYTKIYEVIKSELISNIEMMIKMSGVEEHYLINNMGNIFHNIDSASIAQDEKLIRYSRFSIVRRKFVEFLEDKDKHFGAEFSQTQIFLNYHNDIIAKQ
jgi:hypothetical protein